MPVLTGGAACTVQVFEPDREAADARLQAAIEELSGSADTEAEFPAIGDAYAEEEVPAGDGKVETPAVMRFQPTLAPITAAVFPLVNKDGMPEAAEAIYRTLQRSFRVDYDTSGAIGRRYRRQDEVGTPFCVTIDGETLSDNTVTLRERDSMQQVRISTDALEAEIRRRLHP